MQLDKPVLHHNITVRKAFNYGLTSGIGAVITLGLTYILTEWFNLWYMASVIIASLTAVTAKFIVTAIWVFKK